MCRFALVKTRDANKPQTVLSSFSHMAQDSRAPDGDIQGDGWGISWHEQGAWDRYVAIDPIWQSESTFSDFPATHVYMLHARSASFTQDKNNSQFNQPYCNNTYSFVFNGLLKGMRYPRPLTGTIGAQKIWTLLQQFLEQYQAAEAVEKAVVELSTHAREVQALNLGISDGKRLYVYSQYSLYSDYYTLRVSQTSDRVIVCSEPLDNNNFRPLTPRKVHIFS